MKKKVFLISILLVVCLLLVSGPGCQGKGDTGEAAGIFIGGTQGLDLSFSSETPDSVFVGEMFELGVNLKNQGEFTTQKVVVSLQGLNKEAFGLDSLDKTLFSSEIGGRFIDYPDVVEEDEIIFKNLLYDKTLQADFKSDIKMDVCYLYGSYAVTDICLKREVYGSDEGGVCQAADVLSFENSGAPVQINDVTARPSGKNKIKLSFTIENKGSGEVYLNEGFEDSCRGNTQNKNKVLVNIDTQTIGAPVVCSGFGEGKQEEAVSLIEGKRTIHCNIDTSSLDDVAFG